jgi:hypothetical protein
MILVGLLLGLLGGFILGATVFGKYQFDKALRDAGLSKEAGMMYGRAVRIFRRLSGLAALDGELSGDSLSPQSRKLVVDWLDDYRRLTEKGDPGTVHR